MTKRVRSLILKHIGSADCYLCNCEIPLETKYIRRKSAHNSHAKAYHIHCAKKVNLI